MTNLIGSRVLLRPWPVDDARFVFDLYSRWDVQRYLGHDPRVMENIDAAQALIGRLRARSGPVLGYWAVEATVTGTPVGTVMLLSGTSEPSAEWGGLGASAPRREIARGATARPERALCLLDCSSADESPREGLFS